MNPHDDPLHASPPSSTERDPNPTRRGVLQSGVAVTSATLLAGCASVVAADETLLTIERESTTPQLVRLQTPADL